jgi:hypothetical protein
VRLRCSTAAKALGALVLGLVPVMAGPGTFAADPCGDVGGPCVVVQIVGSVETTRTFTLDDLDALHDIADVTYATQTAPGQAFPNPVNTGTSLRALVGAVPLPGQPGASVDPDAVTYTEVIDPQGRVHPLAQGALGPSGENGFADGLMPVMYPQARDAVVYIRPLRGPDDVNVSPDPNVGGFFQSLDGGSLTVVAHTSGTLLAPVIHAATTSTHPGVAADFTASVADAPAGLVYRWDFGDGTTSSSAAPAHAWTAKGTYIVQLSVSAPDGSSGRATPVLVKVDPTTTKGHTGKPGTGANDDPHAPVTGPSTSSQGEHSSGPTGHVATPSKGTHSGKHHQAIPPAGRPVSGTLLLSAAEPFQPAPVPESSAAAARTAPRDSLGVPAWTVVLAAALALLCLGMASELATVRRGLARLRRGGGTDG